MVGIDGVAGAKVARFSQKDPHGKAASPGVGGLDKGTNVPSNAIANRSYILSCCHGAPALPSAQKGGGSERLGDRSARLVESANVWEGGVMMRQNRKSGRSAPGITHIILGAVLAMGALSAQARADGQFRLVEVFNTDLDRTRPADWTQNGNTIDIRFQRRYDSDRCIGNYHVRFVFDRDFHAFRDGEQFRIGIRKISGSPPCGHKWTRAIVADAGNFPLPKHPRVPSAYSYNGNIKALQGSALPLWEGNPTETAVLLQARLKKSAPYTKLTLAAGENALHFIYRYEASASAPPSAPPVTGREDGINRPGGDFRNFDQAVADPAICEAACAADNRCRAWTWVRPGLQGPNSRCWLKHTVPPAQQSNCCVSGIR